MAGQAGVALGSIRGRSGEKPSLGDWSWTNTGGPVLVNVETTDQIQTSGQVEDVTDVQSDKTDGQSLQPLVDQRPRWQIQ